MPLEHLRCNVETGVIERVPLTDGEIAARQKLARALAWANLRSDRNVLLAGSDWTQLADSPAETRAAWAEYRQKLRDLPANTEDPTNGINWPKPPPT
jgi:Phage tail assembly chaperone protein